MLHIAMQPRLNKPIRLIDMVLFFAEHNDHYLATMSYIEKMLN